MNKVEYVQGADLPDLTVSWFDPDKTLIDFSTGYSFELKIGKAGKLALVTKVSGIGGAATVPNVTVGWLTSGELNTLVPGQYLGQLKATRITDGKQRFMTFLFEVKSGVL